MFEKINNKIKIIFLVLVLALPLWGEAATLYLNPAREDYRIGEKFILEIKVDTDECINAAEILISYPTDKFTVVDFIESRSDLGLWLRPAEIYDNIGAITFIAGAPGGICSEEDILLGEILMEVDEINRETTERIRFWGTSKILLNDGQATSLDISRRSAYLNLYPEPVEERIDPMEDRIKEDEEPPKIFDLKIRRDPSIFNGKFFLIFSAEDRGSGIDYFEISEQKRLGFITAESEKWERWERAESPYILEDQRLRSIIKIRAVDKAGNETIEVIEPSYGAWDFVPWAGIVLFILLLIYILKKQKNKKIDIEW